MSSGFDIREALPRDRAFVVSSWVKSYWTTYTGGVIPKRAWLDVHRKHFNNVLDREDVQTLVAYHPHAEPDMDIYGFLVWEKYNWAPIVHYVYVRGEGFRSKGVGRALFYRAGIDPTRPFWASCEHASASRLQQRRAEAGKKPYQPNYDPRFLRDPEYKVAHAKTRQRSTPDPVVTTRRGGSLGSIVSPDGAPAG